MWAANLPYYSEYKTSKRKPSVVTKDAIDTSLSPTTSPTRPSHSPGKISPRSFNQIFEPAVDGPPSPERIRQLSKQAKRSSHLNRPHGPRAVSSGSNSSSLRSLTGDRPSWEVALENMSLTRRPSNRSTGSSAPSRDRPESIQAFGKSLLHRRGKSNRESAQSSSGSSMYSADMPIESSAAAKESLVPAIFTRRPSRDESAQRRVPISNPFNFQHVTHTNRDDFPERRGTALSNEAPMPAADPGNVRSGVAAEMHFEDFSSEQPEVISPRPPMVTRYTAPAQGPRRPMRHIRSQDQLRPSQPHLQRRPSLPPLDPTACPPMPPVPPPRHSSRQSIRIDDDMDPMDRPLTSGSYHRQPWSPTGSIGHATPSPRTPAPETPNFEGFSFAPQTVSYALTTPDDSAWPLGPSPTAYETPLADVPEEEEQQHGAGRRSRVSLASNNSSLRGSYSVPALRSLAQSQSQQRTSEVSDTLGALEAAPTAPPVGGMQFDHDALLWDGSWEEDIDYCYEHEAEANCDYQWERASVDVSRDRLPPAVQLALADDELAEAKPMHSSPSFPNLLSAAQTDVPALSPVSLASTATAASQDVSTPIFNPSTSNFSLPRGDRKAAAHKPPMLNHLRPASTSSFKESQGFTLSPSLLIPGEYHHQMLLSAGDKTAFVEDDEFIFHTYDRSDAQHPQRVSTSTTETSSTDLTGERHISTNSTWSSLTRHTTSSTSLNKMASSWPENATQLMEEEEDEIHGAQGMADHDEHKGTLAVSKDTVPDLVPFPNAFSRKPSHRSHASESVSRNDVLPILANEQPIMRRPRARTTSVSAQQPPSVTGYSLFPRNAERV
jgi:hypothetical protein